MRESHLPRRAVVARFFALVAALVAAPLSTDAAPAAEPDWPLGLTILTASPGGTYHAYGIGLSTILGRTLKIPVAEQTTEGPVQNIQLIEAGEGQLGFVTMGVASQAWNGTGEWTKGRQFREIRALFPMYDTAFHFVVPKESDIRSLAGLSGRRIGAGPEGGTAGSYVPRFLSVLKIQASIAFDTWENLAAQLEAGKIDVLAAAGGVPLPAVAHLEAKALIRFLQPTPDEVLKLRLEIPELTPSIIPAGSYPSLMTSYQTVGLFNFAVADKDIPADLAYQIVEATFAHRQELIEAHASAAATIPANFAFNTFLPYHPGALRYYSNVAAGGSAGTD